MARWESRDGRGISAAPLHRVPKTTPSCLIWCPRPPSTRKDCVDAEDVLNEVSGRGSVRLTWVIPSDHPQRLAVFYAALLGEVPRAGRSPSHWLVSPQGMPELQFYRPSSKRELPPKGRAWSPCLSQTTNADPLVVLQRWCDQAQRQGAEVQEPARLEPFGAECWMVDPERNAFLLLITPQSTP